MRKRSDHFGGIACRCSGPAQATSRDAVVLGAGTQGRRPCLPAPPTGRALDESACDERERAQGGSALRRSPWCMRRGGAYERPTSMDKETGMGLALSLIEEDASAAGFAGATTAASPGPRTPCRDQLAHLL